MARQCQNFIDSFTLYMSDKGSPDLYVKWSAIFTVGAAMERTCWLHNSKGIVYPSQFIILVGPAGVGKSVCTSTASKLLKSINKQGGQFHIAPSSVTKASLIDALNKAERSIVRPHETPAITSFNSLTAIPNEFGVFLPSWESDFMSVLTDIWNCMDYGETRRTKDLNIHMDHTQINLLSATTPTYLQNLLPEGAWETGFMSRTLNVYSGQHVITDVFGDTLHNDELWSALTKDIKQIYSMFGEFSVTEEARTAVNAWNRAGQPPRPDHPKLIGYNARRMEHLLKLCMIASAADSDEMVITLDHYAEALDWLVELESFMPDIFKSMIKGGDAEAMEECYYFALKQWMRKEEPVPQHMIYAFLQQRSPAHSIDRIIDVMVRAQMFKEVLDNNLGKAYIPRAKQP